MRVYATTGAINLGKKADLDMARALPSQFYTLDMMNMQTVNACSTVKQFVAVVAMQRMLSQGSPDNIIVGGWSLGSNFAFHAAMDFEACMTGVRAVFTLDVRTLAPTPPGRLATSSGTMTVDREFLSRFNMRAMVNVWGLELPRWKLGLQNNMPSFHFSCPLQAHEEHALLNDETIAARRSFYSAGDVHHLPNTVHSTIGSDHYWDIARRLRSLPV